MSQSKGLEEKNTWRPRACRLFLPFLPLFLWAPAASADDDPCRPLEAIRPVFNQSSEGIKANCEMREGCVTSLATQVRESQRVADQIRRSCSNMENQSKGTKVSGQEDAQGKALATTKAAQQETAKLVHTLEEAFNRQRSALDGLAGKMTAAQRKAISSQEAARESTAGKPLRSKMEAGGDADQFAILNGVEFLHQIALEVSRKSTYFDALDKEAGKLQDNREKMGPTKSGNSPSVSDMVQAGSMASGLAGLAGAEKKNSPAGSAVTDRSGGKLGATSPTPDSPAGGNQSGFSTTDLRSGARSPSGTGKVPEAPASTRVPPFPSPMAPAALGGDSPLASEVTKGSSAAPFAGGGYSPSGGKPPSGSEGFPARSETPASAASDSKAKEDELGFGGSPFGGMGSFNSAGPAPPPGNAGDSESAENLKDIYDGMKSAANDSEEGGEAAQAGGVDGIDGEDIFQRVHSCLVRNLRKGRVHNGLEEKLAEE